MEENPMKKFVKVMAVALVAVLALAALVACGPASDPDKALAALKKNDYLATKSTTGGFEGLEAVVSGTKGVLGSLLSGENQFQTITIYYFKDAASANDAWDAIQSLSNKDKDKNSDWVCQKSGKIIYYGTKQAVKDAR